MSRTVAALVVAMVATTIVLGQSTSAVGRQLAEQNCAVCHSFAPRHVDWVELAHTQGPDLSFAGSKFKQDWLQGWLAAPERIRPAGYLAFRYTASTPSGDRVETQALPQHPALSISEAKEVAAFLATLKRDPNPYPQTESASIIRPEVHFTKVLPCAGCHRAAGRPGGVSGPDLNGASQRLNSEWVPSFLADPGYWSRGVMPKSSMRADELAAIKDYVLKPTASAGGTSISGSDRGAWAPGASSAAVARGSSTPAGASVALQPVPSNRAGLLYQLLCSQCHGVTGNGKGVNSPFLFIAPRDHTSFDEMSQLTDDRLFAAIKFGGPAVNKSSLMPAWGATLKDSDVQLLVEYLRGLSGTQAMTWRTGAQDGY